MTNQVFSCTYLQEGQILIAVVADAILVYEAATGEMQSKPIRGAHKDTITCIASSKDSKRFATCSLDRTVVIWKYNPQANPKIVAELKYTQNDSIHCLAFNPLTHQIFSGGSTDYALWTPDQAQIDKQKFKDKIICASWSADGQSIAFGTLNGSLVISDRKMSELKEIPQKGPIWCMEWTPISPDYQESILLTGIWPNQISVWNSEGQQLGQDRKLSFDPLSISFNSTGEIYAISGTNNKVTLYTREGGFLIETCETNDWIWCTKMKSNTMVLACTTNDGDIFVHQLTSLPVSSLYQEKYVSRDQLTDVLITNMLSNQKIRIKCKELVRKVSIYRDKMAALLNERIVIYVSVSLVEETSQTMKYKLFKKFYKKLECEHLCLCASNVLVGNKTKLVSLTFQGDIDRQWTFEGNITTLVACGGPSKQDLVLVGLESGAVLKVFLDNSFPVLVTKQQVAIKCLDLSSNKRRLAIVDANKNLQVIDSITKEVLFAEMGVEGASFNCDFDDLIAYSGNGLLFVKCSSFPSVNQRIQGNIVGFKGQKLFLLNEADLQTIDIQMTQNIQKYIEKKDFANAYRIANLGNTEQDLKMLGVEALQAGEFELAKRCFMRNRDLSMIELTQKWEKNKKLDASSEALLGAEALAYQGRYVDAGNLLVKSGMPDKAVELFTELKRWDDAKAFAKKGDIVFRTQTGTSRAATGRLPTAQGQKNNAISPPTGNGEANPKIQMNKLLKEQAEWTKETGDWKTAADLFVACGDYKKAIELYGKESYVEGLIDVCRQIDKTDNSENIALCAQFFRKLQHHGGAKEAYLKLGDTKSLMQLHVDFARWEEAFAIGRQNPELMEIAKLPYADYLLKNDRYEEALRAYKSASRFDLTTKMMREISNNCVNERRFEDASHYFWELAIDALSQAKLRQYDEFSDNAEIYFAYQKIYNFIEEPFQPLSGEAYMHLILNAARFLVSKAKSLYGVNMSYVYYALGKVSKQLESFKTARLCYEKLSQYKIPPEWSEEIDLSTLLVRSKPFSDNQLHEPFCNRCMNQNPIISQSDKCASCYHPIISSFLSFNALPVVEFKVPPSMSINKVLEIINRDKSSLQQKKSSKKKQQVDDGWNENKNQQVLKIGDNQVDQNTPFFDKLNEVIEAQHAQSDYLPLVLNEDILQTLSPEEVYYVNLKQYNPQLEVKYYKNMVPEIPLTICQYCGKFFLLDEYEFEYLKTKKCPYCKTPDKKTQQKDIFDI